MPRPPWSRRPRARTGGSSLLRAALDPEGQRAIEASLRPEIKLEDEGELPPTQEYSAEPVVPTKAEPVAALGFYSDTSGGLLPETVKPEFTIQSSRM